MKEDFLHYLWRMRLFEEKELHTAKGEKIEILHPGFLNTHAGPDFSNARIRINNTLWAGNVEMHLQASDWQKHGHSNDSAYDNVILHVVLENDQAVKNKFGDIIPCIEMNKRIPAGYLAKYQKLQHNEYWIPCQHHIHQINPFHVNIWLDRLLVERLEYRTKNMVIDLVRTKNNWEESFYRFLSRAFGFKVNSLAFETLARSLPLSVLLKHKNSLFQIESLLFGQAGLLDQAFEDDYPNKLKKEYGFLKKKYGLHSIPTASWKFLRMRPANFPTIRIAQLATLIFQSSHLFSKILTAGNVEELENAFDVKLSNYWKNHYVFDKASVKKQKKLGKSAIHLLIINTIAPFIFLYGKEKAEQKYKDKALALLEALKPESNTIIKQWDKLGVKADSAYRSQALLQLKNEYCNRKRCLECSIGGKILSG